MELAVVVILALDLVVSSMGQEQEAGGVVPVEVIVEEVRRQTVAPRKIAGCGDCSWMFDEGTGEVTRQIGASGAACR